MTSTKIYQLPQTSVLKNVITKYVERGLKFGWKSTNAKKDDYGHWNNLILNCSYLEPFDHFSMPFIEKHQEVKYLWSVLKPLIGERILLRCYINAYTFGTDAYAHLDDYWINEKFGNDTLSETIIVYLNEKWDIDWCGETVIYNDQREIESSVLPKFGRALIFNSNKLHAARPLSRICPVLRSILVFKTADIKINSSRINFLLKNTVDKPNSGRTFFEHLFNTMLKLEAVKAGEDVCLAGLFHSIYDTEFFSANLNISRNTVRDLIGEYSEKLVFEFCNLKNRLQVLLNNENLYQDKFLKDLLLIERANLMDQNINNSYNDQIKQISEKISQIKTDMT